MADASDMDLVREFASQNSETAFAELVRRHINLVYSVALRFTGNPGDAQDVTQAVFIILARKAASLSTRTVLTGWLYETTRFTAIRLLRTQARRRAHEQEAYMQSALNEPGDDNFWRQLAPHLEAAMSRLAGRDRTLLALRFYENKTGAEAAALLGIREEAARKRTNRALEKLRKFFIKRGVDSTAATIAETISANSVQAAPVALAKAVTAVALAKGATASVSTLTLIKGALKIMAWTKAKTAIITGVVIFAAAGTATITVEHYTHKRVEPFNDFEKQLRQKPGGELTLDAVKFLVSLKPQGRLPGFPDTNATTQMMVQNLAQDSQGIWQFSKTDGDTYPLSRTLHASKNNDGNFCYYYTVTKTSATNDWQLQKAWLTDTNGTIVKEFPIPLFKMPELDTTKDAVDFLHQLRIQGRLPGFQTNEQGLVLLLPDTNVESYPIIRTLSMRKTNVAGPFPYHYTVVKISETNGWQLQKAWRTDANGKTAEEFPVP